jgi:spore germination protein KB
MAVGVLYLFFLIHTNGVIIRESSQLMATMILPKTPEIVLNMIMVLLCALAIRGGLEVLARTVEFFFPGLLIVFFIAILMTAPDMHLKNLFPVLENGFLPVLRSSVDPVVWRGEVVIFAVFLPYLAKPSNAGRCGYVAVFVIGTILTLDALANTAVFGPMVETMTFSTFSLIRQVSAASSVERLDVVMVVVWIMGTYGKIALFYYAAVLGTAQLAHLGDYRPLVWPMGVLLVALSAQTANNALELVEYIIKPFPYFAGIFEFLLPTALLLTALVKKKLKPVC